MSGSSVKNRWFSGKTLAVAGVFGLLAAGYWVNQNYEIRLVRLDLGAVPAAAETASPDEILAAERKASLDRPAPIVVRLACVDAGAALRGIKSPRRSLREQLQRADRTAAKPLPNKTCRPGPNALAQLAAESGAVQ
jgi:hypothetical protein